MSYVIKITICEKVIIFVNRLRAPSDDHAIRIGTMLPRCLSVCFGETTIIEAETGPVLAVRYARMV
jgi:hypothetical protein